MNQGLSHIASVRQLALMTFCASASLLIACCADGQSGNSGNQATATRRGDARRVTAERAKASVLSLWGNLRFDLDCRAHGRVVWERDPSAFKGTPNSPLESDEYPHFIVDLAAMRYCEPVTCRRYGPQPIDAVTDDEIRFTDRDTLSERVRRSDGRYNAEHFADGRLDVSTGTCRKIRFSGFPTVTPGF